MLDESQINPKDRILRISGSVDIEAFQAVRMGLPDECQAEECFFVDFSYADLRLPKHFEVVFHLSDPENAELTLVTILGVTQQFSKPWDHIPHGWRTICWLGDSVQRSNMLRSLHPENGWSVQPAAVGLASLETWAAVKMVNSSA